MWEITITREAKYRKDTLVHTSTNVLSIYVIASGVSTVKLMKVKLQVASFARSTSKAMRLTLNKY